MKIQFGPVYSLAACLLALPLPAASAQAAAPVQAVPAAEVPAAAAPTALAAAKEGKALSETPEHMTSPQDKAGKEVSRAVKTGIEPAKDTSAEKTAKSESAARPSHHNIEVQLEYLDARFFEKRDVNLYNIHIYHQYKKLGALSLHYGLTLERALGSTTEDDIYRDAEAVGFGPSYMLRWTRHVSGKLDASIDGTGSILAYNHAHPGNGRSFGFLWRIGPRLTYHYTDRDAISLAYLFHHSSNGFSSHNPGYNGVGFSLGFTHNF